VSPARTAPPPFEVVTPPILVVFPVFGL